MRLMRDIMEGDAAKGSGGLWDFLWPLSPIELTIMSNVLRRSNSL
jgi:hypothetical protein